MSTIILTCALLVAGTDPTAATATAPATPVERRFHEIERDISAAMKRESGSKDLVERGAAVRQMAVLFTEVDRDPRTPTSPSLQEYRGKLRSRLVSVQTELKHNILRANRVAKVKAKKSGQADPQSLTLIAADQEQQELAAQVTAQVSLASYATGGPGQVFEAAGGAFGGGVVIGDHGEELVELIQTTISPSVWQANGGPCTIVYYRPLMCLVVRATGDTHGNVEGLLDGLRRAGP